MKDLIDQVVGKMKFMVIMVIKCGGVDRRGFGEMV